jgi:hypothetical protein
METFTKDNLYTFENTHPSILYLRTKKLIDGFETWEGEVVSSEIKRLTGQEISVANLNKLMAAKTLIISDAPWHYWEVFNHVILGLNGYPPSIDILHKPELHELWYGVETMNILRQENFREDSDVPKYVAAVLLEENVQYAPRPLEFSQIFILNPKYKCKKCGGVGNAFDSFIGECRDCHSSDVEMLLDYDVKTQKELYEKYLKEESPTIPEEADAIAAGRLLIAHKYVELKLKELGTQYSIIKNLL